MSDKCQCNGLDNFLKELFKKYSSDKDNMIQMLNEIQDYYGYVPLDVQEKLAGHLNVELAEVYGVITFYARFSTKPKGKYNISVCMGTACYVKGAEKMLDRVVEKLGISIGETSADGNFSIEETRCVGACGLAPVFTVNGEVYGKGTVQKVDEIIEGLKKEV